MSRYSFASKISTLNSSTGTWEKTHHPDVMVNLYADQVCTILIQFSMDGSTVHSSLSKESTASVNEFTTAFTSKSLIRIQTPKLALQTLLGLGLIVQMFYILRLIRIRLTQLSIYDFHLMNIKKLNP